MCTSTSPSWTPPAKGAAEFRGRGRRLDEGVWSGPLLGVLAAVAVGLPVLAAVLLITEFGILEETDSAAGSVAAEAAPSGALDRLLPAGPSDVLVRGPTAPVAEVAADLAPPAALVYVVVPGDVLHGIARRFGVTTAALAAYNALSNPDALRVGQELRVPPAGYVPPSEAAPAEQAAGPPSFPFGPLAPGG